MVGAAAASTIYPPPQAPAEVAALVAAAEAGDEEALRWGLGYFKSHAEAPLGGAALGRLYVLEGRRARFQLLAVIPQWRGFRALGAYITAHADEPLPRLWRAASAVETNYMFHNAAKAREDLAAALAVYEEADAPAGELARCYLLLGTVAKDEGKLDEALGYWSRAFAADPTGPAGREAARLLALFTG